MVTFYHNEETLLTSLSPLIDCGKNHKSPNVPVTLVCTDWSISLFPEIVTTSTFRLSIMVRSVWWTGQIYDRFSL